MVTLTSFALPANGPRRTAPRPPHLRQASYDAEYDDRTLIYDVFREGRGERVVLMCPPFRNLRDMLAGMCMRASPGGTPLRFSLVEQERNAQIWVDGGPGVDRLCPSSLPFPCPDLPVQPNECDRFAGLRVAMTKNKDNELAWIADWVRFHCVGHGAEAFLIYDNDSRAYSLRELQATLEVAGRGARCLALNWPFAHGPDGKDSSLWDSDFAQYGILEHARWRFLARARSVLLTDIDELVVSPRRESIFAATEASPRGFLSLPRCWVVGDLPSGRVPRFRDFALRERALMELGKYCVVPAACRPEQQWFVHWVQGFPTDFVPEDRFLVRHFWSVNTGWLYPERRAAPAIDRERHQRDEALAAQLAEIFPEA